MSAPKYSYSRNRHNLQYFDCMDPARRIRLAGTIRYFWIRVGFGVDPLGSYGYLHCARSKSFNRLRFLCAGQLRSQQLFGLDEGLYGHDPV